MQRSRLSGRAHYIQSRHGTRLVAIRTLLPFIQPLITKVEKLTESRWCLLTISQVCTRKSQFNFVILSSEAIYYTMHIRLSMTASVASVQEHDSATSVYNTKQTRYVNCSTRHFSIKYDQKATIFFGNWCYDSTIFSKFKLRSLNRICKYD